MDILLGIDPSFNSCGLCKINMRRKKITFECYKRPKSEKWIKDFQHTFSEAAKVVGFVYQFAEGVTRIISEVPPPNSQMSAALYGLDTYLLASVSRLESLKTVHVVQPSYLDHVHGTRKNSGSWHTELGKKLIDVYVEHGYIVTYRNNTICQDEGVALIFASHLLVMLVPDDPLSVDLVKVAKNLASNKEALLYSKIEGAE